MCIVFARSIPYRSGVASLPFPQLLVEKVNIVGNIVSVEQWVELLVIDAV